MSGVSLPVTRPIGRALVVAPPLTRPESVRLLHGMGYETGEADDPYGAMRELCNHRLAYHAVILCLAGLYREELVMISAVKRRFPHLEVWLTQTDGRQGALADSLRLGADGLLSADGLHRIAPEPIVELQPPPAVISRPLNAADALPAPLPAPLPALFPAAMEPPHINGVPAEPPRPLIHGPDTDHAGFDHPGDDLSLGEPVLTADELRALLQDQPVSPPGADVGG